ncbi:MAG: ABC transporter permease [Steroidobacteraceae bacterium]
MLRHYLRMALRGLVRHKLYSFINVAGLAIALACAVLILLFVRDQLSYDGWIPRTKNLYRLELTAHPPGGDAFTTAQSPFPALRAVGEQIPQVRAVTHVVPETMTVTVGQHQFLEKATVVDPNFLQVIQLPLLEGNRTRVLAQPESVVLSESMARKYFGNRDPVGKVLEVTGVWPDECQSNDPGCYFAVHDLTVTGVLKDLPHDTQLLANIVVPNTSSADELSASDKMGDWTATDGDYGYVELAPGARPAAVLTALKSILDRTVDLRKHGVNMAASDLEQFNLTPFRDVHLTSDQYGGMTPAGSRTTVFGFATVAILIVLVACFNFMNLATAQATVRVREIGLRKVVGAKRAQLTVQFLGEAVLIMLLALVIALSLVEILLPAYDRFLNEPLRIYYPGDWPLLAALVAGVTAVGLLSGLYPALVLSGFRPAANLSGSAPTGRGAGLLRSTLVIGQFAVSIGLGIAAMVIFRQIDFARALDLGFDRFNVLVVPSIANVPLQTRERLAHVLETGPGIAGAALSDAVPFDLVAMGSRSVRLDGRGQMQDTLLVQMSPEFPSLYGMHLLAGRLLSTTRGNDMSADWADKSALINAAAARRFGISAQGAVGRTIELVGRGTRLRIVGVLSDAMRETLSDPVLPMIYLVDPSRYWLLSVKVSSAQLPQALAFLDRTWRAFAPGIAMSRYFVSDSFNDLFRSDERQGTMFAVFMGIAILIACLGLFGLAVFTAERRTKEIGIRKVAGARTADIVRLMLWRISVPVLAANLIAWPVAYYYLHRWLESYADRISLSFWYFLAAGTAALLIAWATVYANTLRLARTSPIHSLRYE